VALLRADPVLAGVSIMTALLEESPLTEMIDVTPEPAPLPVPRGKPRRVGPKQRVLGQIAALFNDCCGPRETRAVGILMYHRVCDPPPGKPRPTWNVPPKLLERQLRGLLARGWQAWPLRQVLDCYQRDLPIPRKTFVVTFDDGYANNFIHAYAILTRLGVPATVFLATAYLDSNRPFPSDDWSVAGQPGVPSDTWRPLTSDECRRLSANGLVDLGAHTHTHADFRGRPNEFLEDLNHNLALLHERFGVEQPLFALPYGTRQEGFASPQLIDAARQAEVLCCLTTEGDLVRPGDSPFGWGRFAAEDHDSARTLAGKLGGWHTQVRRTARRAGGKRV
jgi:peptidoglycan/xylan/chitin deacetylase (PgdA/CDA1 family)